jgi:hypothetical protein
MPPDQNADTLLSTLPLNKNGNTDLFLARCLEIIRIEAKCPNDRRRDLLVADRAFHDGTIDAECVDGCSRQYDNSVMQS